MHYQQGTVQETVKMMASTGAPDPRELSPTQLGKVISPSATRSYAELFEWLAPGQLVADPPQSWAANWAAADPSAFRPSLSSPRS